MTKKLLIGIASAIIASNLAFATTSPTNQTSFIGKRLDINNHHNLLPQYAPQEGDSGFLYIEDFENNLDENNSWIVSDPSTFEGSGWALSQGPTNLGAYSGYACLLSGYDSNAPRDAWAFSPAIELKGGVTYFVSIWNFAPGYYGNLDEWQLTIGTTTNPATHNNVVIDVTGDKAAEIMQWTNFTGRFTPAEDGIYYVGIHHCTSIADCNQVMWDYLEIYDRPRGKMHSTGGLWSFYQFVSDAETGELLDPRAYTYPGEVFRYGYEATFCDSVEWEFDEFASETSTTVDNPVIKYTTPEDMDVIISFVNLKLKNANGTSLVSRDRYERYHIINNQKYSDWVGNFKPEDIMYCYAPDHKLPYDALSGLNSTYSSVAERFVLPTFATTTIQGVRIPYTLYTLSTVDLKRSFSVNVRNATDDNMPGEIVYTQMYSLGEIFGEVALTDGRVGIGNINFNQTVEVKGTFFIEVVLPEITPAEDCTIFFVNSMLRNHNDYSTFYYTKATDDQPAGWYHSAELFNANISTGFFPLCLFADNTSVGTTLVDNGLVFTNGKQLNIVNSNVGNNIVIYDITGRIVWEGVVDSSKMAIDTQLNSGIYIVSINGISTKVSIQ